MDSAFSIPCPGYGHVVDRLRVVFGPPDEIDMLCRMPSANVIAQEGIVRCFQANSAGKYSAIVDTPLSVGVFHYL